MTVRNRIALAAGAAILAVAAGGPAGATAMRPRDSVVRVDIQVGLCSAPEEIERALALRPSGAAQEVWLFDDAALVLFEHGLRLRLRVAKDKSELTLKAGDRNCAQGEASGIPAGEGKCEYDLHGDKVAGALSLTRSLGAEATRNLLAGRMTLADALSPLQAQLLRQTAGVWPLPRGVKALGPQKVSRFRAQGEPYDVDVSRLPGGEVYVEISRKVPMADAARSRAELDADLARAGVAACADQSGQAVNKLRSLLR
jgi:hypothetical protein